MKTNGLIEVILYVQDMPAQVAFYRDVFGLRVLFPAGKEDYSQEFWVTLDSGACILALHGGGQKRLGRDTPKIVFGVGDIHAARRELLSRDVAVGEVRSAAPGVWVCDGFDPEGNPFSIESQE
jgi:catechol 2,3-dioxygenase-like lactoylglutathione lyase family enzyme